MLFYLKYVPHDVEKLQELLTYFFDKVEELKPISFDRITLLPAWYTKARNTMRELEKKLKEFINFPDDVKGRVIKAFRLANNIETLFASKCNHIPTALDFQFYENFLNDLFLTLYTGQLSKRLQDKAPFPQIINKDISDHFKKLKEENKDDNNYNNFTVCPFCGIEQYKLLDSEGRPDYDHLLPKGNSLFVFSAVNMKNLFPIGSHCNKLKETKNLLYEDANRTIRTLAFYPYDSTPHPFELIDFRLKCNKVPEFRSNGVWEVEILAKDPLDTILQEKINTWIRVFNIKSRYEEYIKNKDNSIIEQLINSYQDMQKITNELNNLLNNKLQIKFLFIATNEGLVPKRLFYQWALSNISYLEAFANSNNLSNSTYNIDDLV